MKDLTNMNARDQLLALQWAQLRHDEAYHKDVVILPIAQRVKHMALHNAKYTAYLWEGIDAQDEPRIDRALVDAFIIALASANALNQNLGSELPGLGDVQTLRSAGLGLSQTLPRDAHNPLWVVRQFAKHSGHLAKVCESWDHLEPIAFRDEMKASVSALLHVVLAEAAARDIDLPQAYEERMRVVEARSMFDAFYRQDRLGGA